MPWIELVAERRQNQLPLGAKPPEEAKDWFRIENSTTDPDSTDVYVYGSIGGFWGIYADEFIDELKAVTTPRVNLRLNSGGGSVFEGVAVANAIRAHPASFTVYVDSLAASIASVIMLAGDKIVFMPQAQCMVHNAAGAAFGEASEMTKMADLLDRQTRNIADAYAQRTGRSASDWLDMMAEETWFSAQEAVDIGLADEIYMPPKKEEAAEEATLAPAASLMNRAWDLSMYRYAGREHAPEPQMTAVAGQVVTAATNGTGISNTAPAPEPVAMPDTKPTVIVDFSALSTDEAFLNVFRDLVRQEIASANSPAVQDPGPQPDDSPAAPEASGEEQLTVADEAPPAPVEAPVSEETPPDGGDLTTEPDNEADDWTSVIGLLHDPTSPGADDVFAHLKEGW